MIYPEHFLSQCHWKAKFTICAWNPNTKNRAVNICQTTNASFITLRFPADDTSTFTGSTRRTMKIQCV